MSLQILKYLEDMQAIWIKQSPYQSAYWFLLSWRLEYRERRMSTSIFNMIHRPKSALYSTVHVHCMYSACTVLVQCIHCTCTVLVQCMYSAFLGCCTVQIVCSVRPYYGWGLSSYLLIDFHYSNTELVNLATTTVSIS